MKEKILKWLQRALIAVCSFVLLVPCGIVAYAEETTLPDSFEEGVADAIEGMEHLPPSWWDEEQALEMAIEQVKQINVNGELINADWDGEYEYYTLALGCITQSFDENGRYSAYFTFYKEEPIFYLESESSKYILCDAYYGIHLMIEDNGSGGMNISSTTGSKAQPYDYVNSSNKGYRIFEVEEDADTGDNIVSYYHMTYGSYHCYSKSNLDPSLWDSLGLKAPEVVEDNSVNLSVSFNPTLSGAVDRIVVQNGVSAESNYFSMQITNNSSSNAQFVFAVVPSGSGLNLSSAQINRNTGFDMTAANGVFYYTSKEWVWSPTMAVKNNMSALTLTKYYQSSAWHVVKGKSTYSRSFNWNQLDLQAGVEYDAVVWAVSTDCDIPIRNFSNSLADYYIDIAAGAEVYRSTFNVPNPVVYDSSNEEFGNVSNNGIADIVKDGDVAFGYEDEETGETVIEDIYYQDKVEEWADWERVYLEKDVTDFSFDDLTGILSNSHSYFDFLSIVFGWLPSWFWGLIIFGLSSIIVIGIVKAIL